MWLATKGFADLMMLKKGTRDRSVEHKAPPRIDSQLTNADSMPRTVWQPHQIDPIWVKDILLYDKKNDFWLKKNLFRY